MQRARSDEQRQPEEAMTASLPSNLLSLEKLPCFDGMTTVEMPEDWRCNGPTPYTFVFTTAELTREQTLDYHRAMAPLATVNPRLFTPETVAMTSLFHPAFWEAVRRCHGERRIPSVMGTARLTLETSTEIARRRYYLQSLLFLTGVTLSAAIVQNRRSRGTIESKLNRLWQAGMTATTADLAALASLDLKAAVMTLARHLEHPDAEVLIELKKVFAEALRAVVDDFPTEQVTLTARRLDSAQQERFGFVADLAAALGRNLQAVVVYGSSVTSDTFADYDLLLLVDHPHDALSRLAGASPRYRGVELNIGVYGQADFWSFQLASGDNLTDNALCLLGEVIVPKKSVADLLARNYSFAFVRLRQLLGMAVHAASTEPGNDDKKNLYGYFVKIPLNIAKGTRAAVGAPVAKTQIDDWIERHVGYDVPAMLKLCETGRAAEAIATASWCTERVIASLNEEEPAFETTPDIESRA